MGRGLGVGRLTVRQHQKKDFIDKLSPDDACHRGFCSSVKKEPEQRSGWQYR